MLCNRCLPFFAFAKRWQKKRATYREARCATRFSNKNLFRKGGLKKNASTPKIKQGCGSANDAVGQLAAPPLFNRRYPTSLKGARASEAMIHAPCIECLKCLKKHSSRIFRSFRPLRSYVSGTQKMYGFGFIAASVLSPVSPLYYDRPFGRPQRHRAKPIPLRRGRHFFRLRKKYHDGVSPVNLLLSERKKSFE